MLYLIKKLRNWDSLLEALPLPKKDLIIANLIVRFAFNIVIFVVNYNKVL